MTNAPSPPIDTFVVESENAVPVNATQENPKTIHNSTGAELFYDSNASFKPSEEKKLGKGESLRVEAMTFLLSENWRSQSSVIVITG